MKTTNKRTELRFLSAFAGIILVSATAFAGGDVYFRASENENSAAVIYKGEQPANFRVTIQSEDQSVVYYSEHQKNVEEYKKRFDFSNLEDGVYTFVTEIDGVATKQNFRIADEKVLFNENEEVAESVPPAFSGKDGFVTCVFMNTTGEPVRLVFSQDNTDFFTDVTEAGENVTKKFKVSELPAGSYDLTLIAGSDVYTHTFEVE